MEVTVTTVVIILGGSFGAMFAAMVSVMFFSIRTQHRDNLGTRQVIADTNLETRQVIADTNLETRQVIADTNLETRQLITDTNLETRQLIADTNLETRQEATRQIERLGDRLSSELAEHKRIVEKNHDELRDDHSKVVESLSDARERLARIEGHLRIPPPPQTPDPAGQDDRDGEAKADAA